MDKTLIIIDMQPFFDTANDPNTIKEVIKLVKQANKRGSPIIVVEYNDLYEEIEHNCTIASIMTEVKKNKHFIIVSKDRDDGSQEIIQAAKDHGISLKYTQICGVNTGACVRSTVEGLAGCKPNYTFEIVSAACNAPWCRISDEAKNTDDSRRKCNQSEIESMRVFYHNIVAA